MANQDSAKPTGSVGMVIDTIYPYLCEYDLLNDNPMGYTNMSAMNQDMFGHSFELGRRPKFFDLHSKIQEQVLSKKSYGLGNGPWVGVVLRFDHVKTLEQQSEATELQRILDGTDMSTSMFVMRVRIPELHSYLPKPKTVVEPSYDKSSFDNLDNQAAPCAYRKKVDNDIVDMYPQIVGFIREGEASSAPQIGSYVRVDFSNRRDMTGGFYLGPVSDRATVTTTKLYDIANSAFKSQIVDDTKVEEKQLTVQPPGQFDTPVPTEDTQVPKPKPIAPQKKKTSTGETPTTVTTYTQTIIIGEEMSDEEIADLEALSDFEFPTGGEQ